MAVYDTVDVRIALVELAVDKSLDISLRCFLVHRAGVINMVLLDVFSTRHKSGGERARDIECRWVLWISYADMTVRVKNVLVVEDVVRND